MGGGYGSGRQGRSKRVYCLKIERFHLRTATLKSGGNKRIPGWTVPGPLQAEDCEWWSKEKSGKNLRKGSGEIFFPENFKNFLGADVFRIFFRSKVPLIIPDKATFLAAALFFDFSYS